MRNKFFRVIQSIILKVNPGSVSKKQAAELSRRVDALQSMFEAMPDLISLKNPEGRYITCNPGFEKFAGLRVEELTGKTGAEIFTGRRCTAVTRQDDIDVLESGRPKVIEEELVYPDGSVCAVETTKIPLVSKTGGIIGLLDVSRDITESKRLRGELEKALGRAENASRAKTDFLSQMSHEMRTPLNAIFGMINIASGTDDLSKIRASLDKAAGASRHLLGIINDILDMSKIEADKFELSLTKFDFRKMLTTVVNVANVRAVEKRQNLIVNPGMNVPAFIWADEVRLAQVITNLLTNAIKFTPEKGTVVFRIETGEEHGDDIDLRIEVEDNGIGISPEQQKRLFTPFEQADNSISRKFGGTGLGLAISKRIVELMGGRIWIESELNKGSRFIFTVNVKKAGEKPAVELSAKIKKEDIRILAVDDSAETRAYFSHIMASFGLDCDTASSGSEALRMMKNCGGKPYNIFFIDWLMPEMDGIELTGKVKELTGGNSVVFMISLADWSAIEREATRAGVKLFVPKPLFPSTLINAINSCMDVESTIPDADEAEPQVDFGGHRVLIADDIEINREIIAAVLEKTGVTMDFTDNGENTVSMFRKNSGKYSLILMDVQMPVMDGLEAARRIRTLEAEFGRASPGIPIIAMTANVFREDIENCLAAGMNDHIGKPIEPDTLFRKMKSYLGSAPPTEKPGARQTRHVAWNRGLETGDSRIDRQHSELFEVLDRIITLCRDGSGVSKIQDTLLLLVNHTVQYLRFEEELHIQYDVPNREAHKKRHDEFRNLIGGLVWRFIENGSAADLHSELSKTAQEWLVSHITTEDKKAGAHLRRGAGPRNIPKS